MTDTTWMAEGNCAGHVEAAEQFYPDGALRGFALRDHIERTARKWCEPCPVRAECGDYAIEATLDGTVEFGIWGGIDENTRFNTLGGLAYRARNQA